MEDQSGYYIGQETNHPDVAFDCRQGAVLEIESRLEHIVRPRAFREKASEGIKIGQ